MCPDEHNEDDVDIASIISRGECLASFLGPAELWKAGWGQGTRLEIAHGLHPPPSHFRYTLEEAITNTCVMRRKYRVNYFSFDSDICHMQRAYCHLH